MLGEAAREPSNRELVDAARRHLALAARFLGERTACVEFRKHFCAYTKGTRGGPRLRSGGVKACKPEDFEALFAEWLAESEDKDDPS